MLTYSRVPMCPSRLKSMPHSECSPVRPKCVFQHLAQGVLRGPLLTLPPATPCSLTPEPLHMLFPLPQMHFPHFLKNLCSVITSSRNFSDIPG